MTRYWLDTEFIEDGSTIELISIGVVCDDGREYYAVSTEFDERKASAWVKDNVINHLDRTDQRMWKDRKRIAADLITFVAAGTSKAEFWGYYADYDWVVLCQLFGTMMDLPKGWPMYCMDLKQWCKQLGDPKLPEQGKDEHHALSDAKWNKQAWEFLNSYGA